ncbi:MAG: DUF1552 domain-containing protein [Planctomycetota bacterium]
MEPINKHLMSRRSMLRSAGVAIALPLLEAMLPRGLRADEKAKAMAPQRMVLISRPLGMHAPFLFPEKVGKDHETTRYLKPLETFRGNYTVFSGMSHVGYPSGHHTDVALFTGVSPGGIRSASDIHNSVSLDHVVAEKIGNQTRVPSLVLGSGLPLSWNHKGIANPSQTRATSVFKQLFIDGTTDEVAREMRRLNDGQSILDGVRDQLKGLSQRVGSTDRDRIDLFTHSIREAEQRLQQDQAWATKPKPKVEYKPQEFDAALMIERERQWYDIVRLALQTDSTRMIVLSHGEGGKAKIPGLNLAHHDASHHGQDETKIAQLAIVEEAEMTALADFLGSLKAINENGTNLLDNTMVFCSSNLSNSSAHKTDNLPVLLAGGGFKHAGHAAYDRKNNKQLSNLYVRMLQQMKVDVPTFGCSTGTLTEIG